MQRMCTPAEALRGPLDPCPWSNVAVRPHANPLPAPGRVVPSAVAFRLAFGGFTP